MNHRGNKGIPTMRWFIATPYYLYAMNQIVDCAEVMGWEADIPHVSYAESGMPTEFIYQQPKPTNSARFLWQMTKSLFNRLTECNMLQYQEKVAVGKKSKTTTVFYHKNVNCLSWTRLDQTWQIRKITSMTQEETTMLKSVVLASGNQRHPCDSKHSWVTQFKLWMPSVQ